MKYPRWLLAGCVLLLVACASQEPRKPGSETGDRIDAELEALAEASRARESAVPPELESLLMPEMDQDVPFLAEAEPRFDLTSDEVPARSFFLGLVDETPYNMMVHPEVEGTIDLQLRDVTVPEVMDLVRRVYGYEYERDGHNFMVTPARMQSRIYEVNYLNVRRSGESSMRVSSGEPTGLGTDTTTDRDAMRTTQRSSRGAPRASSQIETHSDADFWGNLAETLRAMVGGDGGRSVMVDPQAGLVMVRAMPGELREVASYLEAAQVSLQRQVVLEAKIIEVRLSSANQAGIDWVALSRSSSRLVGGGQFGLRDGATRAFDSGGEFNPRILTEPSNDSQFGFGSMFAAAAVTDDFAALIRLLDTQGDVEVLSSPRVSTINQQKAVIKVGSDEFFVTDVRSQRDVGVTGGSSRGIDVELTPFFSGISLDVTPQISSDGFVTLHVHPAVSEVTDQTRTLTVAGEQQTLPLAFSSVRESDSVVRARHGQVVVIGGLMQDETVRRRAQSGFLGDIPLLGNLFQQRGDQRRQTELVILLRPLIVDDDSDWSQALEGFDRFAPGGSR